MKNRQEYIKRYRIAYWLYMSFSIITMIAAIVFIAISYLTEFRDSITLIHLFLLLVLVSFSFYLRFNALHYQALLLRLQLSVKKRVNKSNRKKGLNEQSRNRERGRPYER